MHMPVANMWPMPFPHWATKRRPTRGMPLAGAWARCTRQVAMVWASMFDTTCTHTCTYVYIYIYI